MERLGFLLVKLARQIFFQQSVLKLPSLIKQCHQVPEFHEVIEKNWQHYSRDCLSIVFPLREILGKKFREISDAKDQGNPNSGQNDLNGPVLFQSTFQLIDFGRVEL